MKKLLIIGMLVSSIAHGASSSQSMIPSGSSNETSCASSMFNVNAEPFNPWQYDPKTGEYELCFYTEDLAPERYINPDILGDQAEHLDTPAGRAKKALNAQWLMNTKDFRADQALHNLKEERYDELRNLFKPKAPYKNPACHPKGAALQRLKDARTAQDAAIQEYQDRKFEQILTAIAAMRAQREQDLELLRSQTGRVDERVSQLELRHNAVAAAVETHDQLIKANTQQLANHTQRLDNHAACINGNIKQIAQLQQQVQRLANVEEHLRRVEKHKREGEITNLLFGGGFAIEGVVVAGAAAIAGAPVAVPIAIVGGAGLGISAFIIKLCQWLDRPRFNA